MRLTEANTFMEAFQNKAAKDLVSRMMKHNYAGAILEHHPDKESLIPSSIMEKCNRLVDSAFQKIEVIQNKKGNLFPLLYSMSRKNSPRDPLWFDEFDEAYEQYKHTQKLYIRLK